MTYDKEVGLHTSVHDEINKPIIDLQKLAVGSRIALVLGEGEDCRRQAALGLELVRQATQDELAEFTITDARIDEAIINDWRRFEDLKSPEMMGGRLMVRFSCTYRRGYTPPITKGQNSVIAAGRHLFMAVPAPVPNNPEQWIDYHAEVLEATVL
jgi:hypothetical protein